MWNHFALESLEGHKIFKDSSTKVGIKNMILYYKQIKCGVYKFVCIFDCHKNIYVSSEKRKIFIITMFWIYRLKKIRFLFKPLTLIKFLNILLIESLFLSYSEVLKKILKNDKKKVCVLIY